MRAPSLLLAAWMIALPVVADAQSSTIGKVWRIGFLRVGTVPINNVFWESMREHSWVLNKNVTVELRYAEKREQLPALAAELAQLNVDLIITNGTPATVAAQQATRTIPIVFFLANDPVRRGIVASMARPGGNATGFAYGSYSHKLLEALKEALPRISRVAYPLPAGEVPESTLNPEFSRAAAALGLEVQGIKIDSAEDFVAFYAAARRAGADAVLVQDSPSFVPRLPKMGAEATNSRLPAIGFAREFAQGGGLLYYGPVSSQHWPRLAAQIDKIFKGAKPGDLPVEQPTAFGFAVNMNAAKTLGITISQAVLLRANERIQ